MPIGTITKLFRVRFLERATGSSCSWTSQNLYEIPNAISRQYNYEKILTMYNDTLQGKPYPGIIMSGTPQASRHLRALSCTRRCVAASTALGARYRTFSPR